MKWPFLFCLAWRIVFYLVSIQNNNYFESDTQFWFDVTKSFFEDGRLNGSNWSTPGYPVFIAFNYSLMGWGHWGLLALQNTFDLTLTYLLMKKLRHNPLACWALALVGACDLSSTVYANGIMAECLSSFMVTCGWYFIFLRQQALVGGLFGGLSCLVRGGNWPVFLSMMVIALFFNKNRKKLILSFIAATSLTLAPWIVRNGLKFGDWRTTAQGDYHWVTLGGGILMRQYGISWADGEAKFIQFYKERVGDGRISSDNSKGRGYRTALFQYILENPKPFIKASLRGLATQFVGGQNAELLHRLQGREISRDPLPTWLHWTLIGVHGFWMMVVWGGLIWALNVILRIPELRAFGILASVMRFYFYASVATLCAPRFRIPSMPLVAFCMALAISRSDLNLNSFLGLLRAGARKS